MYSAGIKQDVIYYSYYIQELHEFFINLINFYLKFV